MDEGSVKRGDDVSKKKSLEPCHPAQIAQADMG